MTDFVAYPSRLRIAPLLIGSVGFVFIGLNAMGVIGTAPASPRFPPMAVFLIGWCSVIFFGLCGAGWAKRFFGKGPQLQIGASGIYSSPWSDQTIPWSEITEVTTWGFDDKRAIVLHLRDASHFPGRGLATMLAGENRRLTGGDISIMLNGTDRSFDEAMAAITHFRGNTAP